MIKFGYYVFIIFIYFFTTLIKSCEAVFIYFVLFKIMIMIMIMIIIKWNQKKKKKELKTFSWDHFKN